MKKLFLKIKQFFIPPHIKLWCGYYGNKPYLHQHENHEEVTTKLPSDFNSFLQKTTYCHRHRVFKEKQITFTRAN